MKIMLAPGGTSKLRGTYLASRTERSNNRSIRRIESERRGPKREGNETRDETRAETEDEEGTAR